MIRDPIHMHNDPIYHDQGGGTAQKPAKTMEGDPARRMVVVLGPKIADFLGFGPNDRLPV